MQPVSYYIKGTNLSASLPCVLVGLSCGRLWQVFSGKKVSREIDGKKVTYWVQPMAYKEISQHPFQPVIHHQFSRMEKLIKTPMRAPIASITLIVSTIWYFALKNKI